MKLRDVQTVKNFLLEMSKLKPKTFPGNSVLVIKFLGEFLMCSMQFLIGESPLHGVQ